MHIIWRLTYHTSLKPSHPFLVLACRFLLLILAKVIRALPRQILSVHSLFHRTRDILLEHLEPTFVDHILVDV
jgi:hypothetical protein